MVSKNGCFIVFEGIDGSGKSTQISLLKEHIEEHSINCMTTMEPSNGPIGTLLRQFLSGRIKGEETTLTALFAADRLDHLNNPVNGIRKLLEDGIAVISDRYVFSNYAYQSVSVPLEWIMKCNEMANETVRPDCHIFIDVARKQPWIVFQRDVTRQISTRHWIVSQMSGNVILTSSTVWRM